MRKVLSALLFALIVAVCSAQNQVKPATQVSWPAVTGSGAPTAPTWPCAATNYGQPYTDTAAGALYVCGGSGGWKVVGGGVLPSNVVLTNPSAAQAVNNVLTLAGTNGIIYADSCGDANPPSWCSGSDGGAWANAAFAHTSSTQRVVVSFAQPVTISTPLVIPSDRILVISNGVINKSAPIIMGNYSRLYGAGQFSTGLNDTAPMSASVDASNVTGITSCSLTSNVVTCNTSPNVMYAGASEVIAGFSGGLAFLNGQTLTVSGTGLTQSQFQASFSHANVSITTDAGTATNPISVGMVIQGFHLTSNANAQDGVVIGNALGSSSNITYADVEADDAVVNNSHVHNPTVSVISNIRGFGFGVGVAGAFPATCFNLDNVYNVGAGNMAIYGLQLADCGVSLLVTSGGDWNFQNSYVFDANNASATALVEFVNVLNSSFSNSFLENLVAVGPDILNIQTGSSYPNVGASNYFVNNNFLGPNTGNYPAIQVGDSSHTNPVTNTVILNNAIRTRSTSPLISLVHSSSTAYNANCAYTGFGNPCSAPIVNAAGESSPTASINYDNTQAASGDLSGNLPAPTVAKVNGGAPPTDSDLAIWDGSGKPQSSGIAPSSVATSNAWVTWTPTDASGGGLAFVSSSLTCETITHAEFCHGFITYPTTIDINNAKLGGLPVVSSNANNGIVPAVSSISTLICGQVNGLSSNMNFYTLTGIGFVTNAQLSGATVYLSFFYQIP